MSMFFTIRSDSAFTQSTPSGPLVEHLQGYPELEKVKERPQAFREAPGTPWLWLYVAWTDGVGDDELGDDLPPTVNVVVLACGEGNEQWYEALASSVAAFLHWEAFEESSGRTIYPTG